MRIKVLIPAPIRYWFRRIPVSFWAPFFGLLAVAGVVTFFIFVIFVIFTGQFVHNSSTATAAPVKPHKIVKPNPVKVLYSEQILGNIWKNPTFWITAFKTEGRECIEVDVTTDALSCWEIP